MKATLFAWLAALLLIGPLPATALDISGRTGFTYQGWTSDADESGSQWHVPIQLEGRSERFALKLETGYASTSGDLEADSRHSVNGFLDTQVGGALFLSGWLGLDWMAGVDLNLPTGQTGEDVRDIRIMIDPDLVDIVSPGQGFNVNPYIGAAKNWNRWTFGLGAGYAIQGAYDYSDQTRDYDPGDMFNLAAQVEYALSEAWRLSFQTLYGTVGTDQIEDQDLQQKGDTWLLKAALRHTTDTWDLALSVQTIMKGKARLIDANGGLVTEARDSQGDEWIFDLQGSYHWRVQTSFNAGCQYLYLAENDYEESSDFYMGRREKFTLSLGVTQQLTDTLDLECALQGFVMNDDPSWLHPNQEREYKGWSASAAVTHHF